MTFYQQNYEVAKKGDLVSPYDIFDPKDGILIYKYHYKGPRATGTGSADPERMPMKEKLLHQLGYAFIR